MLKNLAPISMTKLVSQISRSLSLGHGSTWPGHIALTINPNFIKDILTKNPHLKVILIAGTNGKTTTTKLLKFILEKKGFKVFQNESGANLLNGIASSLIIHAKPNGKIHYDIGLFEIDENTLPLITHQIKPHAVLLLNLFRDQLDRYGEVNTIAKNWHKALTELKRSDLNQGRTLTQLFVNGDDPQLTYISQASGLKTNYFGIEENLMKKKELSHDVDFAYCPNCGEKLNFIKNSYSHMGIFKCPKCGFKSKHVTRFSGLDYPLFGTYNKYNTNAAILLANKLFDIPLESLKTIIKDFKPAFGRQEVIVYKGKKVNILLSKNPASFNQSLQAVAEQNGKHLLLVLNDRIPDGRDVSWIWDVDFEEYLNEKQHIHISGDRVYDMGLRLKYATETQNSKLKTKKIINHKSSFIIHENLSDAIEDSVKLMESNGTLYIMATYSAMLEVRLILTGKKIL